MAISYILSTNYMHIDGTQSGVGSCRKRAS